MIATAGGSYDVPAFRPTSQSHSAVTAYSWIPHTAVPAILDQAEIVGHLDRSGCFLVSGDRRLTILLDNPMTQFSFEWILSLNWLCQEWGQVQSDSHEFAPKRGY